MTKKKTELSKDQINILISMLTVVKHDIYEQLDKEEDILPWFPVFLSKYLDELRTLEKVLISLKGDD
jgi:hypothetical protein|tara:strand:- start:53 stop:253 length:201 start_codon:yes stop_codon:yes gene_type:complete